MSTEWLAIQSFQHSQDLLAAINTLSIHTKLELSGITDEKRIESAARARETLNAFLEQLEAMVRVVEKGDAVLGTDPRQSQLVRNFIAAKHNQRRFRSVLFHNSLSHTRELLKADSEEDRQALIKCLEELRVLLEEHIHIDTARILGGF